MKTTVSALLLLAAAAPVSAAKPQAAPAPERPQSAAYKPNDFDVAKLMAMFDKIFPAQPEPAPERLALARLTAAGVLPNGTYAAIFNEVMSGMVDRVLSLSGEDFKVKGGKDKGAASTTLREEIAKGDPYFEERMRITRRVIGEELIKISAVIEPKLRDGLARSIARRFDDKQLHDINAFLATDSGKVFAGQSMRMWVDPDVMRSMIQAFPELIAAAPGAISRIEAETAHLPKPTNPETKKPAGDSNK